MSTVLSTTNLKPKPATDLAVAATAGKPRDEIRSFREELDSRLTDGEATSRAKAADADSTTRTESAEPTTQVANDEHEEPIESTSDEVAERPMKDDASDTIEEPRASEGGATTEEDTTPIEEATTSDDDESSERTSSELAPEPVLIGDVLVRDAIEDLPAVPSADPRARSEESSVDATAESKLIEARNVAKIGEPDDHLTSSPDEARPAIAPKLELDETLPTATRAPKTSAEAPQPSSPRESTPTSTQAPRPIPEASIREVPTIDDSTAVTDETAEVDATIARSPDMERESVASREPRTMSPIAVAVAAAIETTPTVSGDAMPPRGAESPLASLARIGADRPGRRGETRREPQLDAPRADQGWVAPRILERGSDAVTNDPYALANGLTEGNLGRGVETPKLAELGPIEFRATGPAPTGTQAPASNSVVADLAGPNSAAENARTLTAPPAPANVPVQQILAQVQRAIRPGMQELRIRLDPPALGSLTVKFALEGDSLAVIVRASRPEVVEALKNDLQGFADSLSKAGIDLTTLDVSLDTDARRDGRTFHEELDDAGATQPHPNRARTTPRSSEKAERSDATSALLDVMA